MVEQESCACSLSGSRAHGRTHGRTHGPTHGRTDARSDDRTVGRTDGRTDGRTYGRMDGRTCGRMDGWTARLAGLAGRPAARAIFKMLHFLPPRSYRPIHAISSNAPCSSYQTLSHAPHSPAARPTSDSSIAERSSVKILWYHWPLRISALRCAWLRAYRLISYMSCLYNIWKHSCPQETTRESTTAVVLLSLLIGLQRDDRFV